MLRRLMLCCFALWLMVTACGKKNTIVAPKPTVLTGTMIVFSNPTGATVMINNAARGVTPDTLREIAVGTYSVAATLPGFHGDTWMVGILSGETTQVLITLDPNMTGVLVTSTPSGATVFIDGVQSAHVTPDTVVTTAGMHQVRVALQNYTDFTSQLYVLENHLARIDAHLYVKCPGDIIGNLNEAPAIHITTAGGTVSGTANNVDARHVRVVLWALTNQWYVQPYIASPYTSICGDGTWSNYTHPWNRLEALLVDETYYPGDIRTYDPKNDPGVLAYDVYPRVRNDLPLQFSGRTWDIKIAESPFGPGPNYFSDSVDNVWVDTGGRLHLKIVYRDGKWYCSEILLPQSLGYGVYTVQIDSPLNAFDGNVVAAPEFTYESQTRELDFECAGDALIPGAENGQFVVQPYTTPGNLTRFTMPSGPTTCRIEWRPDQAHFTVWQGQGSFPPDHSQVIQDWVYTGSDIPPPGGERLHINLWLFNGQAPTDGQSAELIIRSFTYEP